MRLSHALVLAVAVGGVATFADADSSSEFRQSAITGSLPEQAFGLSVLWNRDLGSGYSSISIVRDTAVTMFTEGDKDVLAVVDPSDGREIWRYDLGEKYAGHDGSDDGPLSTPAISHDRIYALTPRGRLLALRLADGSLIWNRQLDETNSTPPLYGYSSSPVTVDDLVILATGGDGHALTAFDRDTGDTRWTAGDDSVHYQSPFLLELKGRSVLVLASDFLVHGFDPTNGDILFEHRHIEGQQAQESQQIVPIDGDSFVVNLPTGSVRYRFDGEKLEQMWQSRAFANSLAIPVLIDGYLYGFTGHFLTCSDAATGEIVWRSRPPGGLGLSLIGDKLAVVAPTGDLVLVGPTPDGYTEITRIKALESGNYATATFADGVFFIRNLEQMAAVAVDTLAAPQPGTLDLSQHLLGELANWVASVSELSESERQSAVDSRFADLELSPFFEGEGLAHFFWRGQAEDIGLESDEIAPGAETGMYRLPGTDLFLRSAELDPKGQYTYALTIDYEDPVPDPRNSYTVDNGFNVVSELRMPGWPASPHLESPADDAPRGDLDTFQFRSDILDNTREIQVWRPPGYGDDLDRRYPLLVVNHGDNLLRGGLMRNTLDNLVGKSMEPVIAVFVPRLAPPEYGGPQVDDYLRFLIEELLPHLDYHYLTDGTKRSIMGPGSAGVTAVYAALQHSETFQRAAAQSFYPIEPAQERLPQLIANTAPGPEAVYLVWSRRDYDLGDGRTAEEATKELAEMLRQGGVPLTEQTADYSPGWGGWRGQHDEILKALFPLTASQPGGDDGP